MTDGLPRIAYGYKNLATVCLTVIFYLYVLVVSCGYSIGLPSAYIRYDEFLLRFLSVVCSVFIDSDPIILSVHFSCSNLI